MHAKAAVRNPKLSTGAGQGRQVTIFEEGAEVVFEIGVGSGCVSRRYAAGTGEEGNISSNSCPQQGEGLLF